MKELPPARRRELLDAMLETVDVDALASVPVIRTIVELPSKWPTYTQGPMRVLEIVPSWRERRRRRRARRRALLRSIRREQQKLARMRGTPLLDACGVPRRTKAQARAELQRVRERRAAAHHYWFHEPTTEELIREELGAEGRELLEHIENERPFLEQTEHGRATLARIDAKLRSRSL